MKIQIDKNILEKYNIKNNKAVNLINTYLNNNLLALKVINSTNVKYLPLINNIFSCIEAKSYINYFCNQKINIFDYYCWEISIYDNYPSYNSFFEMKQYMDYKLDFVNRQNYFNEDTYDTWNKDYLNNRFFEYILKNVSDKNTAIANFKKYEKDFLKTFSFKIFSNNDFEIANVDNLLKMLNWLYKILKENHFVEYTKKFFIFYLNVLENVLFLKYTFIYPISHYLINKNSLYYEKFNDLINNIQNKSFEEFFMLIMEIKNYGYQNALSIFNYMLSSFEFPLKNSKMEKEAKDFLEGEIMKNLLSNVYFTLDDYDFFSTETYMKIKTSLKIANLEMEQFYESNDVVFHIFFPTLMIIKKECEYNYFKSECERLKKLYYETTKN